MLEVFRAHQIKGRQVITDKIIKGAGSHRILMALMEGPRHSKDLKRIVGAINSVKRFEAEYMERLESNGYVILQDDGDWSITVKGQQKCLSLRGPEPGEKASPRTNQFTAVEGKPPVFRPGSMDFREFPSRRGSFLYYRDGRVEEVSDGH